MKKLGIIGIILLSFFFGIGKIDAKTTSEYINVASVKLFAVNNNPCTRLKEPLKFLGHIIFIIKIVVPIILIVFGMIDLFKAVTGGKDGEITKSLKSLVFRIIAGVAIFFVPSIISFIFTLVDDFDNVKSEYDVCQKCILNVSKCDIAEENNENTNEVVKPGTVNKGNGNKNQAQPAVK